MQTDKYVCNELYLAQSLISILTFMYESVAGKHLSKRAHYWYLGNPQWMS